ncbi:nucleotide exchange factor GrpE [Candidatus Gottesmanbacteria bacterium RIFCSPHIGHO2_02_FULL_40_24]|uniref:Protein GrpE n=1 Tax=Candidatus Gottesmanbacteria bacterium RIFCSPHIGHO2_01_FULL_40_15 TaxID=1798376 RepID=A0A1F5Z7J2_9BACT|nr:MAG: nucleotide exchange factor GrpE [Candidatus Gottesmanbacteria bacterium RIFCSPHIGHO2_01_FULL_40_15]OGG16424.1 MAG: nucleotide exchange factor GrpE [Candidatus Gottesmanbacteria bacterium RIFCSPHIGHO2_02_FULL_40_24]OGG22706.1 MAG: nucleotide exchange factor GrpE [Candidatus Gottesmanbacteria bacterium RIFCSPLOWO2_01_FULL_40_10]OGG32547.1 MAG: nucleotide exchange factor GrpE [Candidatus Gottesmanbacteria bacterium RIFCSPLOWO2_02_FULL_40_10]
MKKSNNTKTVQENEPNKGKKPDQDKKSELNSDEWKDKYLRALADYRNLERRVSEKAAEVKKFANKDFILKLLPIIDDLETAAKLLPDKGLELILNKFINLLQEENVEKVDCLDRKFDPTFMECVSVTPGKPDNQVIGQIRPAYMMNNQVLRPAQVIVNRKAGH